jgi:catechol 2,3-dioxygenase-like lactoylglutathione lyase family enzyme
MPAKGIHHLDLTVGDVERSLSFYLAMLGPLGLVEEERHPSYRGTEEVVVLRFGTQFLGVRPADGGEHRYYETGIEHIAFEVDNRPEVDDAYQRCVPAGGRIHYPPDQDRQVDGYYSFFAFDPDGIRVEVFCWNQA